MLLIYKKKKMFKETMVSLSHILKKKKKGRAREEGQEGMPTCLSNYCDWEK